MAWPVRAGAVPPLASAFQPRRSLRDRIDQALGRHASVVLCAGGGVGKSQMAAACAHQALAAGTDVVVWVNAAEVAQVVTGYSAAALRVQAPGAQGQDAEADAKAFRDWLAVTPRSWLVVLDDLTDMEGIEPWWPPPSAPGSGRVLATTRRRDALISGGGRTVIEVGTYDPGEAIAYLRDRFTGAHMAHLLDSQARNVLRELGHLPLALTHAAAYMLNEDLPCAHYLQLFTDRQSRLETLLPPGADTEGYGRPVAAALLLTLDAAQRRDPAGIAAPALCLAAHLDPAGHPLSLWDDPAVTGYLAARRNPPAAPAAPEPAAVTAQQARAALRLLHRYGLISYDSQDSARAVRLHALTARAARETAPAPVLAAVAEAAADALATIWPEEDHTDLGLAAVLRANADVLAAHASDLLWQPDSHPVLSHAGRSLLEAGMYTAAVAHWQRLAADAERLLGGEDTETLAFRTTLTHSYCLAGRTGDAIALGEQVAADAERLGGNTPETTAIRAILANCYAQEGRVEDAIALGEQVVADAERQTGDSVDTLTARSNLAAFYSAAGRAEDAIALGERVAADRERILGEDHPQTLASRSILAGSYAEAGRVEDAIALGERVAADRERILGEDHPTTLEALGILARLYYEAGRTGEAIALAEQVAADAERLGDGYTATFVGGDLAAFYLTAERVAEATALGERVVADAERILKPDHPHTLRALLNLSGSYAEAGRVEEAIPLLERAIVGAEHIPDPDVPDTTTARIALALCYEKTGRTREAAALLERVLAELNADPSQPGSMDACYALAGVYERAGRVEDAIPLLERAAAAAERILGPSHPDTFEARAILAVYYRKVWRIGEAITVLKRMAVAGTRARVDKLRPSIRVRKPRG